MQAYLDHAATTPVHPEVLKVMAPYWQESFGNPSSIHSLGKRSRTALEKGRQQAALLIGADPGEIVFTSGGTEADNLAVLGAAASCRGENNHIITTVIEHRAVLNSCEYLLAKGFQVTFLPVDEAGVIRLTDLERSVNGNTVLISIMHGNNEIGTVQPIAEIGRIARKRSILFHTDAVQTAGKLAIDVKEIGCDLLSFSGHKIHGPKGAGALYIRDGVHIGPLFHGGHQESGRRSGTENVPAIAGFGHACETASAAQKETAKVRSLRDLLQERIEQSIPEVRINGHPVNRLPHILSVSFRRVDGDALVRELDQNGVAASAGAACSSGSMEISHVISALGMPRDWARGTVRFSLGFGNNEDEIRACAEIITKAVRKLRTMAELEASVGRSRCY